MKIWKNIYPHRYTWLMAICLNLFFCGCGKQQAKYRIGVAQCSSDAWRTKMNEEIMREQLFHDDVEIEIRSAEDDSNKQKEDLRYFASHGFDIICIAPNEAEALTPIIDSLYHTGMPIVIFDRGILSENYTAFHGADNYAIGKAAAQYAQSVVKGQVNAIEIFGLSNSTPAISRHEGFVHAAAAKQDFNIVATGIADWNSDKSARVTDSLLRLHPETNLIYAHNDLMAIAASRTAKGLGRHDIKVIGIDAAPNVGMQAVADSLIDATFIYSTAGDQLIKTAIAIVKGEPFERINSIPYHSAVDLSNVEILMAQNKALSQETDKINVLKKRIDIYLKEHAQKTIALYAIIIIVVLGSIILLIMQRMYWQKKRYQTDVLMSRHTAVMPSLKTSHVKEENKTTATSSVDRDFYDSLVKAMRARMGETDLSVDDIASDMQMSRIQLYRKTKTVTGYTPNELLRNLRLQHADMLLKTTNNSIAAIASSVGFTSPSYFTKCFREYFGETPTIVQERHLEQ